MDALFHQHDNSARARSVVSCMFSTTKQSVERRKKKRSRRKRRQESTTVQRCIKVW